MVGRGVLEVYINGGSTDITLTSCRSKGRPRTAIGKEQLEAFLKLKIPLSEIASALKLSAITTLTTSGFQMPVRLRFSKQSKSFREAIRMLENRWLWVI